MTGAGDSLEWMFVAVFFSAAISFSLLWLVLRSRPSGPTLDPRDSETRLVFIVKDGAIIDQSNNDSGLASWTDLRAWLGDRFSGVPDKLDEQNDRSTVFPSSRSDDQAILTICSTPQGKSITLDDSSFKSALGHHCLLMERKHSEVLQNILERAPAIVFSLDEDGKLGWGNGRFEDLSTSQKSQFIEKARSSGRDTLVQLCLDQNSISPKRFFELFFLPGDDHVVVYANEVTRLVEADNVRTEFVQTLTKTFADLSTGLAVFDRDQRLVLFNPAILDLTNLPVDFLVATPHMIEFFDRLRDNHMMPEPKNYATWRTQIQDMIKTATNGHYSESWFLPGGLTYKLTGRPHPNGAVAFLIEDVTDEIALTRQSRGQLETHQSILDAMQDAIAVMGPDGGLLVCNSAFSELVGFDPDAGVARTSFKDVLLACKQRLPNTSVWDSLSNGPQIDAMSVRLTDEARRQVDLRVEPLPEGLVMLKLSIATVPVSLSA